MPPAPEILAGLHAAANGARPLAVVVHLGLGCLLVALLRGWRPPRRLLGALVAVLLFPVAAVAWSYGNFVNTLLPGVAGTAMLATAVGIAQGPVRLAGFGWRVAGAAVLAYGWVYPHFLQANSPLEYFYAAPLGVLPCPTLAAAAGVALLVDGLRSRAWSWLLAGVGLVYGFFGILYLGIWLDAGLVLGSALLAGLTARTAADPGTSPGR